MKAAKIALATLITSLAISPLMAQAQPVQRKHTAAMPGVQLKQVLQAMQHMGPQLDVQPATPEPNAIQMVGSNYANAGVLFAALPVSKKHVQQAHVVPVVAQVHATLTNASY